MDYEQLKINFERMETNVRNNAETMKLLESQVTALNAENERLRNVSEYLK